MDNLVKSGKFYAGMPRPMPMGSGMRHGGGGGGGGGGDFGRLDRMMVSDDDANARKVTARMAAAIPGATSTLPDLTQAQICRTSTLPRDIKAVRMTPTR
jgi:hypothetical protein